MEVTIHPGSYLLYSSFYYEGLKRVFGVSALRFSTKGFPFVNKYNLFAFIVKDGNAEKRFVIDYLDAPITDEAFMDWADVYGKVNIPLNVNERKIVPIGPSFCIISYDAVSLMKIIAASTRDTAKISAAIKSYYTLQRYRKTEQKFIPKQSEDNYVFFSSSLWKKEGITNENRRLFIETCKSVAGLTFEGGFIPRDKDDIPGFEHVTGRSYMLGPYLERTQRSAIVFNTPVVKSCHSWKLAENMALGKACVSTAIARQMPESLEHGVNIHFAEPNTDSMLEAIEKLHKDLPYRRKLENNARRYYDSFLAPQAVVSRLIKR